MTLSKYLKPAISLIRLTAALLTVAVTWPALHAEDLSGSSPAYNFLNVTSSSRIYGLGGVNITLPDPDNIFSIDQNPALLGPEFDMQIGVSYMHYIGDSNFAALRFGNSAGERGAWTAAINYFGYGSMTTADENGIVTGSYSPKDITFSGGYTHDLSDSWRGGFAIKLAHSSYGDYSAMALCTDLGLSYFDPDRDLSFSLVVANLGGQIKRFNDSYDRLPIDVRLGWSKRFGSLPIRWSVTAWNLTRWHLPFYDIKDTDAGSQTVIKDSFGSNFMRHLVFAADFVPSDKFYAGIGYNYKTRTDMATYSRNFLSGFSLCAGINLSNFGIGLAFSQPHSGATTLMVNFNANLYSLTH